MYTVVLYCWCHSDSASVLLYFTFKLNMKRKIFDFAVIVLGFVLFARAVRHEIHDNHFHLSMLRKLYMTFLLCFYLTIDLTRIYVPICIFSPFSIFSIIIVT